MSNTIEFKNVTKRFNNNEIFKNLNLEIKDNMITAIMADSGFGKTTIARMIAGLDNDYEGEILISNGLSNKDISYMFQEDRLIENISIYKNLKIVRNDREKILDYLIDFELEDKMDIKISKLSGGMKRRVALIRSLILEKKIVILDEPFNGLDEKIKSKIFDILKQKQHENKCSMIVILHSLEDAKKLADNIIQL